MATGRRLQARVDIGGADHQILVRERKERSVHVQVEGLGLGELLQALQLEAKGDDRASSAVGRVEFGVEERYEGVHGNHQDY